MAETKVTHPDHTEQEPSEETIGGDVSTGGGDASVAMTAVESEAIGTDISADTTFQDLLLKPELLKAIQDRGFERPTEVQRRCIPPIISGKDVLCEVKSGTGKSTAIILATLQNFTPEDGKISMIVICHSRERANQIAQDFRHFSKYLYTSPLKVEVFCGGHSAKVDKKKLNNNCPHIVIGTLGRTMLLLHNKFLNLKDVTQFVVDECGPLLEQNATKQDLEEMYRNTAHEKQVVMFSSRLIDRVRPLCRWFFKLQEPIEIHIDVDEPETGDKTKKAPEKDSEGNTNEVHEKVIAYTTVSEVKASEVDADASASNASVDSTIASDSDTKAQTTFKDLKLKPGLIKALEECGFEHPTEVQNKSIPPIIDSKNVLCEASSGTGKSMAIVLATLQNFTPEDGKITMIIVCATRVAARDIMGDYRRFSRDMFKSPIKLAIFQGGTNIIPNRNALKNDCPHIIVGTLGRVVALLREKILPLNDIKVFGVHNCGQMLEQKDSRKELQLIFQKAAHEKQVLLFSGPMHDNIRPLCRQFFKSQEFAYIDCSASNDTSEKKAVQNANHYYINLREYEKEQHLLDCMHFLKSKRVLIYVKEDWKCQAVHVTCGESTPAFYICLMMPHMEKKRTFNRFQRLDKGILVVTKLKKGGALFDENRFDVVIHYDFPDDLNSFTYMISKAGRKPGQDGMTVTFVLDDEVEQFKSMQESSGFTITELNKDTDWSTLLR
ncbi:ATP-dependent RNA helicase DDX39A-like [Amphiura filiformis]|uniref:ATP-dependent RNA helicase DDX39A-like n=1 Tax=Amphiura filiformis TaxID=82378 RepID=UPI003B222C6D